MSRPSVSIRDLVGKRRKVFVDTPMACPVCGSRKLSVIDSRGGAGNFIRRRRGCVECDHRFTTFEVVADENASREAQTTVGTMLLSLTPDQFQALRIILSMIGKNPNAPV